MSHLLFQVVFANELLPQLLLLSLELSLRDAQVALGLLVAEEVRYLVLESKDWLLEVGERWLGGLLILISRVMLAALVAFLQLLDGAIDESIDMGGREGVRVPKGSGRDRLGKAIRLIGVSNLQRYPLTDWASTADPLCISMIIC